MKNYKFNNINGLFVPPQVEKKSLKIKNIYDNNVLFLGSLFMINNQEAIIWYLKNIHDFLSETVNDYKLTIAGNTRNQAIEWLRKKIRTCKYNNNIQIYDTPSDLEDIYKNNSIFINPMLNGAGVKLKTIEAIKYGLLIVSTKIGIEGTGLRNGEHVLVGNDVEKFKMGLLKLIRMDYSKKKQLSLNSQEYIEEEFDNTDKIKKYLNDLVEIDNEKS
ncbi:glycosyltransferase family 4 protein [Terrilactibacillus sp. S3-3]|nr:glycosyltransferase family 4 protein [Terrilactibacillus sp. S3-3]